MAIAKCGHAGCTCLPAPGTAYCNSHCEGIQETSLPEEVGCGCGHIGCDPRSIPADVLQDENLTVAEADMPLPALET